MPPKQHAATKRGPNRPKDALTLKEHQLLARKAHLARIRRIAKELHAKRRPKRAHRECVSATYAGGD